MNVSADLSFYPIRHLDSGSQECPDISAIQNRIKVSSEDLLTLSCNVFTSGLFFFMLICRLLCFIPEKLYSHLLKMFHIVFQMVTYGMICAMGKWAVFYAVVPQKPSLPVSYCANADIYSILLPQPPKLPLQLPLQSPSWSWQVCPA